MKTQNRIITGILSQIEDAVSRLIQQRVNQWEQEHDQPAPEWLAGDIRMQLIYDMCRAIEKHTLTSDELGSIHSAHSEAGSIVIDATVIRDGEEYDFRTEMIFAGGYNVQCLHVRYITKTNLPKVKSFLPDTVRAKSIVSLTKKLRDAESTLNMLITVQEKANEKAHLAQASDDDILQHILMNDDARYLEFYFTQWEQLNELAQASHGTPDAFYSHQAEELMQKVSSRRMRFRAAAARIKSMQKDIEKVRAKIRALMEQISELQ